MSSQLLSVASANAIHSRFVDLLGEVSAQNFLKFSQEEICAIGLSKNKYQTMKNLALAELAGELNYQQLAQLPADKAIKRLTKYKGIGDWSAQIYLLFCVGHCDIFPAGDLVLQKMLAQILNLDKRPNEKQAHELTNHWSPYKSAGARLLWRYFAAIKNREGIKFEQ